jgi:dienelactone hydrolase
VGTREDGTKKQGAGNREQGIEKRLLDRALGFGCNRVMRKLTCLMSAIVLGAGVAWAQAPADSPAPRYVVRERMVPVMNAGPQGLDVLEVYVDLPGRHPLVVLTHGSAVDHAQHAHVTPWGQWNQALWFARRGYVSLVVVRKGYGRSGGVEDGHSGGCGSHGSFEEAGEASAEDLRQIIGSAAKLPEVDPDTVLSAGVSTGGFAQVALSADPPKGLKAAISFAGGRGSDGKEHNCDLGGLEGAFHSFGKGAAKHGALPMLWIYSENDHYFPPAMAVKFDEAYRKGGGADEFVMAPPDGDDGHHLYAHIDAWPEQVTAFLKAHGLLPLGDTVLPPPAVPDVPAPGGLHGHGVDGWKRYLAAPPFRAFAMTADGFWGDSYGQFDQAIADHDAVEHCKKAAGANGNGCQVVARTPAAK